MVWIAYRARRFWSSRRAVGLATALVILVVASAITFAAAGASRTLSMAARYEATFGGRFDAIVEQTEGLPRTDDLAELPSVTAVSSLTFVFGGLATESGEFVDAIVFAGQREATGARLVTGRAPRTADEFVASARFLESTGAALGDRFTLVTFTQAQAEATGFDTPPDEAAGPTAEVTVVGSFAGPVDLQDETSVAVFPPDLLDLGDVGDVGIAATQHVVGLAPGARFPELRRELDTLADGASFNFGPAPLVPPEVDDSIDARGLGIAVLTVVVGLAAVAVVGQMLTRQVRLDHDERLTLRAVGADRRQLVLDPTARAVAPLLAAVFLAGPIAFLASDRFPLGFTSAAEPDPGRLTDATQVWVPLAWALLVLAWVALAMTGAGRLRAPSSTPMVEEAARRLPDPRPATGLRFAFTRSRSGRPVAAPLIGLALVMAGIVAASAFGASVDRLIDEPWRYGTFDAGVGQGGGELGPGWIDQLRADPDVDTVVETHTAIVSIGTMSVDLTGFHVASGSFEPIVFEGRTPAGDDEVLLGRVTAREQDVEVGDQVVVSATGGRVPMTVSGIGVTTSIDGGDGAGEGGMVTEEGMLRIEPAFTYRAALVDLRPGADLAEVRSRFDEFDLRAPDLPAAIGTLGHVRVLPYVIAAVLAVLALLGIGHQLVTAAGHRRRDLAVIRSIGADRRWASAVLHWQAVFWTAAVAIVAVPLGIVVGRVVARSFIERTGAVPDPAVPVGLVLAGAVGLVLLANVAALAPAYRLRRGVPADALRDE